MGFKKRAAATAKIMLPEGARKEAELIYLCDMVTKIETFNTSHQLVLTWIKLLQNISKVPDIPWKNLQVNLRLVPETNVQ